MEEEWGKNKLAAMEGGGGEVMTSHSEDVGMCIHSATCHRMVW
jgi:hypothetical protein